LYISRWGLVGDGYYNNCCYWSKISSIKSGGLSRTSNILIFFSDPLQLVELVKRKKSALLALYKFYKLERVRKEDEDIRRSR
jgi:hypothetical protein